MKKSNKKYTEIEEIKEKIELQIGINSYKMDELLDIWHDEDEQKAQRRRLWKLAIIEHQEDDEFLKRMGLVHVSKLKENGGHVQIRV